MGTKTATFEKGVKNVLILLGLLIFSPIVLSFAFKALNIFTESPKMYIGYFLLVIGISLMLFTMYFLKIP